MSKFSKIRDKTELQSIKDDCKLQNFNYDKTKLTAEYDTMGNIIKLETKNAKLKAILSNRGFDKVE